MIFNAAYKNLVYKEPSIKKTDARFLIAIE